MDENTATIPLELSLMQETCEGHNLWPGNDDDPLITVSDDSNGCVAEGKMRSERVYFYYKIRDGTI